MRGRVKKSHIWHRKKRVRTSSNVYSGIILEELETKFLKAREYLPSKKREWVGARQKQASGHWYEVIYPDIAHFIDGDVLSNFKLWISFDNKISVQSLSTQNCIATDWMLSLL